jgi:hypothetical protein
MMLGPKSLEIGKMRIEKEGGSRGGNSSSAMKNLGRDAMMQKNVHFPLIIL